MDAGAVARFHREMELTSKLDHANVMRVIASGVDEQAGAWYAMPVAAGSLADGLKRPGPFRDEYIVEIMRDVCTGLAYIHGQGVLHRDLKPDNILRTSDGGGRADFGLAREVVESARLTRTGRGLGTPLYMAPEQWGDASRVTAAADVYAAVKVVQEMMAGMPPATSDVPPGLLAPVVRRAISPDPALRYQSAGELLAPLQVAVTPGYWEPAAQKAGRLRAQLAAGPTPPRSARSQGGRARQEWRICGT